MKTTYLVIALAILSSHALAGAGELYNAEVTDKTSITKPAKAMKAARGQWLAFSLPVLEGTRSPCCWKGRWSGEREVGCSLEARQQSYGTSSDSPLTDTVTVFAAVNESGVTDLRVVGEHCPVDGNGANVTWIGEVNDRAGLDWLESVARDDDNERAGDSALYALALHRHADAGKRLYTLAKDPGNELSEEAVFWLGEARGEDGFNYLERLLAELPKGDNRRAINFALAQNDTSRAAELLVAISKSDSDPEQRGEAMFWLAEAYPRQAQPLLLEVIKTEQDEDVLEQAVFAISQLPDGAGDQVLLDIAKNDQLSRTVRRQALFWLANSDNESSVAALADLLSR
jgi:hypothetical protein